MRAMMMKVNYDPRYMAPHQSHQDHTRDCLQRLARAKGIYDPQHSIKSNHSKKETKVHINSPKQRKATVQNEENTPIKSRDDTLRHKEGVAKAHLDLQYNEAIIRKSPKSNHFNSPYSEKLARRAPLTQAQANSNFPLFSGSHTYNSTDITSKSKEKYDKDILTSSSYHRSQSLPSIQELPRHSKSSTHIDKERQARKDADKAIRERKVFTIVGPYHGLRRSLRKRGWVEKFLKAPHPSEIVTSKKALEGQSKIAPWQEENGVYGLMSHYARNSIPSFLFTVKTVDVEKKQFKGSQIVNHFSKAGSFTTKTGLCRHLRDVPWFYKTDSDTFYPRCYKIDDPDDKDSFWENYQQTACISFVRCFVKRYQHLIQTKPKKLTDLQVLNIKIESVDEVLARRRISQSECHSAKSTGSDRSKHSARSDTRELMEQGSMNGSADRSREGSAKSEPDLIRSSDTSQSNRENNSDLNNSGPMVTVKALEFAVQRCESYLKFSYHDDIDSMSEAGNFVSDAEWEIFYDNFRKFVIENGQLSAATARMVYECEKLLIQVQRVWTQYELDGHRNVWILKPGAKSRGRGIVCTDSVHSIRQNITETGGSLVIQKYMETPLLVHNCKFDIRQWFIVTDWNPLTIWYYNHCYLRFCTQEFTLDNMHESIHLSNNSVQKNYRNGKRSDQLPDDNMWCCEDFDEHLKESGYGDAWHEQIVPGMKKSILCSMLCTQEAVEDRKSAFELYGADFMITEDLQPWLLEINSSPSMCVNTKVMEKLVEAVLDDMVKVVIDRKENKQCDTGDFQLLYRQSAINDPPMGDTSNLKVHGRKIRQKWQSS